MTAAEENARRRQPAGAPPLPPGASNPWESDALALGQIQSARSSQTHSDEQIAANKALGEQEFGLRHELGANGVYYDDYRNNPWSQAALLQHAHESNAAGINTTAGQALYSGQTGNAQGIEAGNFWRNRAGLEGDVNRAEGKWSREETEAEEARKQSEFEAKEKAIERALEAEPPEVPLPGGGGGKKNQHPVGAKRWAKVIQKKGKN